MNTSIK